MGKATFAFSTLAGYALVEKRQAADNNNMDYPIATTNTCITHWGRVTHICVGNLTIIGSDNGLSPGRRQAIIWTNAGILLIGPLGTNFGEILAEILTLSFTNMYLKVSSVKWRPFCLGLNVISYRYGKIHLTKVCKNFDHINRHAKAVTNYLLLNRL